MTKNSEEIPFYKKFKPQREGLNINLDDISIKTNINKKYLVAIENGDFDILPNVYIRLFLKTYATILKMDINLILEEYEGLTNKNFKKINIFKKPDKLSKKTTEEKSEEIYTHDKTKNNYKKNIIKNKKSNDYFLTPQKIFSSILA